MNDDEQCLKYCIKFLIRYDPASICQQSFYINVESLMIIKKDIILKNKAPTEKKCFQSNMDKKCRTIYVNYWKTVLIFEGY